MAESPKTELVKDENGKTRLVSTPSANMSAVEPSKKVRIRAMHHIAWGKAGQEQSARPGTELEVDEEIAREFCDRKFEGNYAFGGERGNATAERFTIVRAVRL